jgi:hypothetical protein
VAVEHVLQPTPATRAGTTTRVGTHTSARRAYDAPLPVDMCSNYYRLPVVIGQVVLGERTGKITHISSPCHHSAAGLSSGGRAAARAGVHRTKSRGSWGSTALLLPGVTRAECVCKPASSCLQVAPTRDQTVLCWWSTPTPVDVVAVCVHAVLSMCQYSKEHGHLLPAGGLQLRQKTPNNLTEPLCLSP